MNIVELYLAGYSSVEIAELLKISTSTVFRTLKRNNIKTRSNKENSRRFSVRDDFFEDITTEEQAYWLGFLLADGYITKPYYLGLSLATEDASHVEKFQKALKATYEIKHYQGKTTYGPASYSRLLVCSEQLIKDLQKYNLIFNKTLVVEFPYLVPEELRLHLIRGYFDGDGSWAKDKKCKVGYSFKLCGTKEMLTSIAEILGIKPINMWKRYKDDGKNNYYLSIGGKRVKDIADLLYKDATIYLQRKFERYQEMVPVSSNTNKITV